MPNLAERRAAVWALVAAVTDPPPPKATWFGSPEPVEGRLRGRPFRVSVDQPAKRHPRTVVAAPFERLPFRLYATPGFTSDPRLPRVTTGDAAFDAAVRTSASDVAVGAAILADPAVRAHVANAIAAGELVTIDETSATVEVRCDALPDPGVGARRDIVAPPLPVAEPAVLAMRGLVEHALDLAVRSRRACPTAAASAPPGAFRAAQEQVIAASDLRSKRAAQIVVGSFALVLVVLLSVIIGSAVADGAAPEHPRARPPRTRSTRH